MASVQRSAKRQRWIAIGVAVCASAVLLPWAVVRSAPVPIVQPVATTAVTQAGLSQAPPSSKRRGLARVDLYPLPSPGTSARSREDDLELHLFPDVTIRAVFERFDTVGGSGTWVGHVDGVPMSAVALAYRDGLLTGSVNTVDHLYDIQPVRDADRGEALHVVTEADRSQWSFGQDVTAPPSDTEALPFPPASSLDGGDFVDLMVVYTAAGARRAGGDTGIANSIALGVSITNAAYANSGIRHRLRLVHQGLVPYSEASGNLSSAESLTDLAQGRDGLSGVATLRDTYGADLVMLLADYTGFDREGRGFISVRPSGGDPRLGFATGCPVGAYCLSLVFPHELGHVMGSAHDWFEATRSGFSFGYGHVDLRQRVMTLMSYPDRCLSQGLACGWINYFSNPDVEYIPGCSLTDYNCDLLRGWLYPRLVVGVDGGAPADCQPGVEPAAPCQADNRRLHDLTAPIVASYRQSRY